MATGVGVKASFEGMSSFTKAMQLAAQQAKSLTAEMKSVAAQFSSTDKSEQALTARNEVLGKSLEQAKSRAELFRGELSKQTSILRDLSANLTKATIEFGENSDEVSNARVAYDNQLIAVEKLQTKYNQAQGDVSRFTAEMEQNYKALTDVKRGFNDAGNEVDEFGREVEKGSSRLGDMVKALGLVKIASAIFNEIRSSVSSAFERIDTMEQFERTMTAITGSSELASKALEEVRQTVTGTAYGLNVGAKAVQNLVTSGTEIGTATKRIESWADAVSFYGDGTNASLETVADALAKMTAAGKVAGDQINRLTDVGIPVVQIFADATGRSVEDVRAALSNGEISAEQFMSVLQTSFENGTESFQSIAGAAQEAGSSWSGTFDNMKAAVTRGMMNIINAIDEGLKDSGLASLREMIAGVGKSFENGLNAIAPIIKTVVSGLAEIWARLEPIHPLLTTIGSGLATFGTMLLVVAGAIKVASAATAIWKTVMSASPIGIIIAAVAALVVALIHLWNTNEDFRNAIISAWEAIKSFLSNAIAAISGFFNKTLPDAISNSVNWLSSLPRRIWDAIVGAVSNMVKWGVQMGQNALAAAKGVVTNIVDTIKSIPSRMLEIGKNIVQGLWDGIVGMGTWLKDKIGGFVGGIVDGFKDFFGIASPAKVLADEVGKFMPQGIAVGFDKAMPAAIGEMQHSMQGITDSLGDTIPSIKMAAEAAYIAPPTGGTAQSTGSSWSNVFNITIEHNSAGGSNEEDDWKLAQSITEKVSILLEQQASRKRAAMGVG